MKLNSSRFKILALAVVAVFGASSMAAYVSAKPAEQVIKVVSKKFDFSPNEIKLKKGVPVILEFTTLDVVMGFSVPDLGARVDIIPGQVSRLRLVPDKVGTFPFVCDIFCGSGHEDMTGTIIVSQ